MVQKNFFEYDLSKSDSINVTLTFYKVMDLGNLGYQ